MLFFYYSLFYCQSKLFRNNTTTKSETFRHSSIFNSPTKRDDKRTNMALAVKLTFFAKKSTFYSKNHHYFNQALIIHNKKTDKSIKKRTTTINCSINEKQFCSEKKNYFQFLRTQNIQAQNIHLFNFHSARNNNKK